MDLSSSEFFKNCEEIFGIIGISEMIELLNTQIYKGGDVSFQLKGEDGGEVILIKNSRTGQEKMLTSFHDLEDHFLQDAVEAKKLVINKGYKSDAVLNSSPEESVQILIQTLLAVAYQEIKAHEEFMPQILEIYKREIHTIMSHDAKKHIEAEVLELYTDKEIHDMQMYFGRENYYLMYGIIKASNNERINIKRLLQQEIADISFFQKQLGYEGVLRGLNNTEKHFNKIWNDAIKGAKAKGETELNLEDYF